MYISTNEDVATADPNGFLINEHTSQNGNAELKTGVSTE